MKPKRAYHAHSGRRLRAVRPTIVAVRICPVCSVSFTGTGVTRFDAEVEAQKAVLRHQLDHPYEDVRRAQQRKPS